MEGIVYILLLDKPLGNERHSARLYVGWAKNLDKRLWCHEVGLGSAFTRAAAAKGIKFTVVYQAPGTRDDERAIKNYHNTRRWLAQRGITV